MAPDHLINNLHARPLWAAAGAVGQADRDPPSPPAGTRRRPGGYPGFRRRAEKSPPLSGIFPRFGFDPCPTPTAKKCTPYTRGGGLL